MLEIHRMKKTTYTCWCRLNINPLVLQTCNTNAPNIKTIKEKHLVTWYATKQLHCPKLIQNMNKVVNSMGFSKKKNRSQLCILAKRYSPIDANKKQHTYQLMVGQTEIVLRFTNPLQTAFPNHEMVPLIYTHNNKNNKIYLPAYGGTDRNSTPTRRLLFIHS